MLSQIKILERILYKKYPSSKVYLVGGAVRDKLMKRVACDLDVVVTGVPKDQLEKILAGLGALRLVGKSFGVYKWNDVDIAIPRRETGWGTGARRDVTVQSDHTLSIEKDLERRDFTINAIAYDMRNKLYIDPHDGRRDIQNKIIRTVGDPHERFTEDNSRLLRALRIAIELNFEIEPKTRKIISQMIAKAKNVTKEIAATEIVKAISASPEAALKLFNSTRLIPVLFPELALMQKCKQPKKWHSEGTVWTHTLLALRELEKNRKHPYDPTLILALILHDSGKVQTRKRRGNKITFYNHATVGARIARRMIKRLKLESAGVEREQASWLIKHHMIAFSGDPKKLRNTTIERYFLSDRYPSEHLMTMIECDSRASVPLSPDRDNLHGLSIIKKRIAEIKKKPPKALLNGEEIMTILNIKPGVEVGKVIARLREAQLSGRVNTKLEAREFLQKLSVKS